MRADRPDQDGPTEERVVQLVNGSDDDAAVAVRDGDLELRLAQPRIPITTLVLRARPPPSR